MENQLTAESDEYHVPVDPPPRPKLLVLKGRGPDRLALRDRLGDEVEVITVASPVRALTMLASGEYDGVYADAEHFSESLDLGQLLQNERILRSMPEGVVLLNADNIIMWGNGRLAEWSGRTELVGQEFYSVLHKPEWVGIDSCPLKSALTLNTPTAGTLRCTDGRFLRMYAVPIVEGESHPHHLVVTLRDVTDEVVQQQKLAAIHQAGVELADLLPDEVSSMDVDERVELLKDNIRRCTQDVLQYDVVEVRSLNRDTNELMPLLSEGMQPEAERRHLFAEATENGVTGYVAATGKSYLCEDTSQDGLYLSGAPDARSSLTVPLILHDDVIGTLNVESPEPQAFGRSDLQFLEIFSRELAVALNTLDLLAAEKAYTTNASIEAIHSAVAIPVDDILNDVVHVMERFTAPEPQLGERLHRVLRNARDIKKVIHDVGQTMAPVEARPASARGEARPTLAGRRVLVVDSDGAIRSEAHDFLEKYRCIVETSHDGSEAIFMVRNLTEGQHYDAIISDIKLPDMTGYDLMMRLRKIIDPVPMVLTTGFGYDAEHTIVKSRREGLKHVLFKPFRPEQLLDTVESMVNPDLPA